MSERARLFITNSHKKEIQEVVDNIVYLNRDKAVKLKQIAILFRSWACGTELSQTLLEKNIPFFSEDSKNIWNKDEVRDLIAYLNLAFEDDIYNANKALLRIINRSARKFGPKSLAKLEK